MARREVRTQAELDAALAAGDIPDIVSDAAFMIRDSVLIYSSGSSSPTLRSYDSSSPTLRSYDSSSPTLRSYGSSSPTLESYGSSSPTLRSYDSSSPTLESYDSSSPRHLGGKSRITSCSPYSAVLYRTGADVSGVGHHIELPEIAGPREWCGYYGVETADETAVLFKQVDDAFQSGKGTDYAPGSTVTAADFNDRPECGGGLHLCPRPGLTNNYAHGGRLLAVRVRVDDIVVIPGAVGVADKCKVPSCEVLYECDRHGNEVASAVAS